MVRQFHEISKHAIFRPFRETTLGPVSNRKRLFEESVFVQCDVRFQVTVLHKRKNSFTKCSWVVRTD